MAEKVTYYAIVDSRSTAEHPAGLARRVRDERGMADEVLNRNVTWQATGLLAQWDRAESTDEFVEVGEDEAERIMAELRERWSKL